MQNAIVKNPEGERRRGGRTAKTDERKLYLLWPPFPGFEGAFAATWPTPAAWKCEVDREQLIHFASNKDANKRAYDVVSVYCEALSRAKQRDEHFHVMVCVIPDEVWVNCRPKSRVKGGSGKALSKAERYRRRDQSDMFRPDEYELSVDFRRQLKARAMEFGIPIQIVRESTLRIGPETKENSRGLTPESDRAWNIGTTMYYKAGGKPWRLATAREGVSRYPANSAGSMVERLWRKISFSSLPP